MGASLGCKACCSPGGEVVIGRLETPRAAPEDLRCGEPPEGGGPGGPKAAEEDDEENPSEAASPLHQEGPPESPPDELLSSAQDETAARLGSSLGQLRELCREGRIFDAMASLRQLEADAGSCSPGRGCQALEELQQSLKQDPVLAKLRETHERMQKVLGTMGPGALPGGPEDKRWVHTEITDSAIGPQFRADIRIRFAEGVEREAKGASAQLITCGILQCFPMDLDRFVSVYRETDLYRKDWIDDCEKCEGAVGGADRFYSALSRIINSSPLLPFRMEVLTVREFAVCSASPLAGKGPGVLVMDMSAPADADTFAGWKLPQKYKNAKRLTGLGLILYFQPRPDKPGCCDVFAFAKAGVPVPQWLIPLGLVKRFLASHFISVFKAIKTRIADQWEKLGYHERIAGCQDFYGSIARIGST